MDNKQASNWKIFSENLERRKETMHTTLIIMAAGLGTRFGEGIKQLGTGWPGRGMYHGVFGL